MATSGKYCDLTGLPTIPTNNNQLTNGCWYTTCTWTVVAWDLTPYAKSCTLCTVATSGKYCDLTGTPSLATVATSGKYCDLSWKPTIPTDNSQLANGCGYTTCTGTISNCAWIISALWYTPYNSSNPSGYTTCTWTLTNSSLVTVNGCCLVGSWNICIQWWVSSVNGCTWAVCLSIPTDNCQLSNWCGYITTAPVTSVNGQTGAVTVDGGITKIFELADTSDLTTAQAAYDWYDASKEPIVDYNWRRYHLTRMDSTYLYFTADYVYSANYRYAKSLKFTVSSWNVTNVELFEKTINITTSVPSTWDANTIYFVK